MVDAASEPGFVVAGRDGARPFDHHVADLGDVRLHYVTAGQGDPLVLLAGFPQSWYAWRKVIPRLAERFRVIAVDLPGQGALVQARVRLRHKGDGRRRPPPDRASPGGTGLLGRPRCRGVGRIPAGGRAPGGRPGGGAAGSRYPRRRSAGHPARPGNSGKMFHFLFHLGPDFPEQLISRPGEGVRLLVPAGQGVDPGVFTEADIDEYTRCFAAPGGVRAALGWYPAVPLDAERNREFVAQPLDLPIVALGGKQGSTPEIADALRKVARRVEGETLENCGHYPAEEQPEVVANRLLRFFETS